MTVTEQVVVSETAEGTVVTDETTIEVTTEEVEKTSADQAATIEETKE